MNSSKAFTTKTIIILLLPILIMAMFASVVSATTEAPKLPATLDNVRAFAASPRAGELSLANAGGQLVAGNEEGWHTLNLPEGVIPAAVAVDSINPKTLYVGAANETALYRSIDGGEKWLRVPLSTIYKGAVSALAVESTSRMIYAGTDQGALFRMRDVGSSLILAGEQTLPEGVEQVAVDNVGNGLAFARTASRIYQAQEGGLSWKLLEFTSTPTALAIANTQPATVYVGTIDSGILKSNDGMLWLKANEGLGEVAGSRLQIDALAVDPAQPEVLYAATSFLFGGATVHQSPVGVVMSTDSGESWKSLREVREIAVTDLLPVSGQTGAVYALFANSRTPFAIGDAPALATAASDNPGFSWQDALTQNTFWTWVFFLGLGLAIGFVSILLQRTRSQHKLATQKVQG